MIASLPMYWRDETAQAWVQFWDIVQRVCDSDLPDLTSPEDLPQDWAQHWLSRDLGLSMTCGLPLRTALRGQVTYVGTFDFGLAGPTGYYDSVSIRRPDSLHEPKRLAYNAPDSQSGWAAIWDQGSRDPKTRFSHYIETGSHAASLAAVADGRADIAWIDAVTWRLLRTYDPNAARVDITGHSTSYPGLPLITAKGTDPAPLRHALWRASQDLSEAHREALGGLHSFEVLQETLYSDLPLPPAPPA